MPAYLLSVCEVTNPGPKLKEYTEKSAELVKKFGGKYVVRGKASTVVEGDLLNNKVIIMTEFPSRKDFEAFYHSDEYQKGCRPLREGTGIYDIGMFGD